MPNCYARTGIDNLGRSDLQLKGSSISTGKPRCYGYDVLRIACAVSVCLFHFEVTMSPLSGGSVPDYAIRLTLNFLGSGLDIGSLAVSLFFMLSGALAAKSSLCRDNFSVISYIKHRLLRLLPPLWISWFLTYLSYLARGSFHFDVPAWRFILTVLGLDGYASYGLYLGSSFYYCGEWFYGAIILVSLFWPLLRLAIKKMGSVVILVLVLCGELTFSALSGLDSTSLWRSLPVCLASFTIGVALSNARLNQTRTLSTIILFLLCLVGLSFFNLPDVFRLQLLGGGIFGIIELQEQSLRPSSLATETTRAARAHRILVRLSNLTLYFFMWQFTVIRWVVPLAAGSLDYTFGAFDYWGLALTVLLITLLAAVLTQQFELTIRRLLS